MWNRRLTALPMFDGYTGEIVKGLLMKVMDALLKDKRAILVGITTDGDRTGTGRIRGLVKKLKRQLNRGVFHVRCGLRHLDLLLQAACECTLDEFFLSLLTKLISELRRRQNLISTTRSGFPKFSSVRWLSMGNVLKWLVLHGVEVRCSWETKRIDWAPEDC